MQARTLLSQGICNFLPSIEIDCKQAQVEACASAKSSASSPDSFLLGRFALRPGGEPGEPVRRQSIEIGLPSRWVVTVKNLDVNFWWVFYVNNNSCTVKPVYAVGKCDSLLHVSSQEMVQYIIAEKHSRSLHVLQHDWKAALNKLN